MLKDVSRVAFCSRRGGFSARLERVEGNQLETRRWCGVEEDDLWWKVAKKKISNPINKRRKRIKKTKKQEKQSPNAFDLPNFQQAEEKIGD